MKKRKFAAVLVLAAVLLTGCGVSINTGTSTGDGTTGGTTAADETKKYGIGETWTVDGQWSLTVNSITETSYRNEYSDLTPTVVYMISYTYTNIGYTDASGIMSGLYLDMESTVIGSDGVMGQSYPGEITNYPQETPVGATCNAEACVGVNAAGTVEIHVDQYDGNGVLQSAVFALTP